MKDFSEKWLEGITGEELLRHRDANLTGYQYWKEYGLRNGINIDAWIKIDTQGDRPFDLKSRALLPNPDGYLQCQDDYFLKLCAAGLKLPEGEIMDLLRRRQSVRQALFYAVCMEIKSSLSCSTI